MIPRQVALYHRYHDLIRSGEYYRLASYRENHLFDCWQVVSPDGAEALITFVQVLGRPNNFHSRRLRLQGLDPEAMYREETTGKLYRGDALLYAGLPIPELWGDFRSCLLHLSQVNCEY